MQAAAPWAPSAADRADRDRRRPCRSAPWTLRLQTVRLDPIQHVRGSATARPGATPGRLRAAGLHDVDARIRRPPRLARRRTSMLFATLRVGSFYEPRTHASLDEGHGRPHRTPPLPPLPARHRAAAAGPPRPFEADVPRDAEVGSVPCGRSIRTAGPAAGRHEAPPGCAARRGTPALPQATGRSERSRGARPPPRSAVDHKEVAGVRVGGLLGVRDNLSRAPSRPRAIRRRCDHAARKGNFHADVRLLS